jgi:hypothetical protein
MDNTLLVVLLAIAVIAIAAGVWFIISETVQSG